MEQSTLFRLIEQSFSPEQDEKAASEMSKFQIGAGLLEELCRLEWKYLRKAA
jgi:hypothetical protein